VLSVFEANEIRKNRYPYEHEGRRYAIDVFLGALHGLALAETEFETDEEMRAFALPSFAFLDVTNDEMFTGGRLVDLTIDEIRAELKARAGKGGEDNELSRGRVIRDHARHRRDRRRIVDLHGRALVVRTAPRRHSFRRRARTSLHSHHFNAHRLARPEPDYVRAAPLPLINSMPDDSPIIYTIGHGRHAWRDFLALLKEHEIAFVCDVRSAARSRWPQFNGRVLEANLREARIGYEWLPECGG
jgi:hypothetical protein